jgi:hypothetical protein
MKIQEKIAIAALSTWWLGKIVAPAKGFYFGYTARRDEHNGFAYTAAMEWRTAARLFAPKTLAAEYCWQQWERIMHLPRQFAQLVSAPGLITFPTVSATSAVVDQIHVNESMRSSLPIAA